MFVIGVATFSRFDQQFAQVTRVNEFIMLQGPHSHSSTIEGIAAIVGAAFATIGRRVDPIGLNLFSQQCSQT